MSEVFYAVTIEIGDAGTDAEKAQLLANMLKRISEENSCVGEATARVTDVSELT